MTVTIERIFTMDPNAVWTPKDVFSGNEGFGINMVVSASPDLVEEGHRYHAQYSIVNPENDPSERRWWMFAGNSIIGFNTIDRHKDRDFDLQDFGTFWTWQSWDNAMRDTRGPGTSGGVYSIRGSIFVLDNDDFDITEPFAFNFRVR